MASNTEFLDLLMKDPVADKADTFNIETMLNENWRKIDENARRTTLRPETAALFGLDPAAVLDDVLGAIGNGFSRIVSGTVTGSYIASEDSPNSITFPFEPKLVIVTDDYRNAYGDYSTMQFGWFFWVPGVEKDRVGDYGYGRGYRYYKQDGNTLSWWVEQGKTEDTTYAAAVVGPYVAFG